MDHKNTMQGILIGLSLLGTNAYAECYARSAMTSKALAQIERIADMERQVLPVNGNKQMCRVFFRAYIEGQWHGVEAEETGSVNDSLDNLCARAVSSGQLNILESISGTKINATQEMICTDQPKPSSKTRVNIGDNVWESEVQPHPVYQNAFGYRGSECRWFIESRPQVKRVDMQQGIICRSPGEKVWKVVDKW